MAVSTRWVTGAAVLAATLGPVNRAAAAPPDLVVKTRTFLPGKDVIAPYGENFIYTPTAPQNGRLIILFPGSSMDRYEDFMTTAAAHGYHVLGLDSPLTAKGQGDACPPQAECYPHLLRQAVDGDMTEVPPFWSRDFPQARYPQAKNSIAHRLVALLEHVKAERQGIGSVPALPGRRGVRAGLAEDPGGRPLQRSRGRAVDVAAPPRDRPEGPGLLAAGRPRPPPRLCAVEARRHHPGRRGLHPRGRGHRRGLRPGTGS